MSDDLKTDLPPELSGTVHLAHAALNAPAPPAQVEAVSRRQVEALMQEAALSPRVLREAVREQPHRPWWRKLFKQG